MPKMRMGKADRLSRKLDWKVKVEKDNENQVVVKEDWLHSMQEVVIEGPEVVIIEKIKKAKCYGYSDTNNFIFLFFSFILLFFFLYFIFLER